MAIRKDVNSKENCKANQTPYKYVKASQDIDFHDMCLPSISLQTSNQAKCTINKESALNSSAQDTHRESKEFIQQSFTLLA